MAVHSDIARLIDHTLLRQEASRDDIIRVCREAREYEFASACVNPYWVPVAAEELHGSVVKVCSVAGFPLGATCTQTKVLETESACAAGAGEIDMVQNVGALKSGDHGAVAADIQAVVRAARDRGAIVKVILETALLTDAEKRTACEIAEAAGAAFVKTSTGFGPGGATVEDVALLRASVSTSLGVKASGGIRTMGDVRKMLAAGATRIGASASVAIVQGAAARESGY